MWGRVFPQCVGLCTSMGACDGEWIDPMLLRWEKNVRSNEVETKYSDHICQQDTIESTCGSSILYPVFLFPEQLETGYSPVPCSL